LTNEYPKLYKKIKEITEFLENDKIAGMKGTFTSGWRFSFTKGKKSKKMKLKVSM